MLGLAALITSTAANMGLCSGFVLRTVLVTHRDVFATDTESRPFLSLTLPHHEWAEGTQEAGREYS